jgi:hypothetical protein
MSASVSVFRRFLFPTAPLLLQQLILLALKLLTQTDLSPSPRKIHQLTGNTFQCFYSRLKNFLELNRQAFVQPVTVCQLKHLNFIIFLESGSSQFLFFLKKFNFFSISKNIFILSLHTLVKNVQGLRDVS